MTRHLFRLMWNRKRQNLLLSIEVFFSFVVVMAVAVLGLNYANNWRRPLGFAINDVWRVHVYVPPDNTQGVRTARIMSEIAAALRAFPEVQSTAAVGIAPYSSSDCGRSGELLDGRDMYHGCNAASDDFADVIGLEIVAGRWFSREDNGANPVPIVINQQMARDVFGDANPVGQVIPYDRTPRPGRNPPGPPQRVIGVFRDYRAGGEFATPRNYAFDRIGAEAPRGFAPPGAPFDMFFVVRVAPDTTAAFEEKAVTALTAVAGDWGFSVAPLSADRESSLNFYRTSLTLAAVVVAFLLLMVALGLSGVVWQNVTERTREFGLRRAKGATANAVRSQVLKELAILATIAILPGVVLAAQIPALPLPQSRGDFPPDSIFVAALAVSVVAIYLVVFLCGWYPSRLATSVRPAEALHYE
jgi:putative ABC transport system permease protein